MADRRAANTRRPDHETVLQVAPTEGNPRRIGPDIPESLEFDPRHAGVGQNWYRVVGRSLGYANVREDRLLGGTLTEDCPKIGYSSYP